MYINKTQTNIHFYLHTIVLQYEKDYFSVYEATSSVVQWYALGSLLKVAPCELERIDADYRFSHDGLVHMLSAWLKSGDATWLSLVHALRKIGQSVLASKIARDKGVCVCVCVCVCSAN